MAAIEWFRLWHDMPNDPKWRTIARISGQSISVVQAVWLQVLVSASQAKERGTYTISEEDIASALNESDEAVIAVITAMQGRVLDCNRLSAWARRQPSREDGAKGNGKSRGSNYVYYVADTERDVVKLGISRNPWSRVKDIQVGSSSKFELLATMKTDELSEKELHKFFSETRLEGEWFRRSKALNSLIQKTASKEINTFDEAIEYLLSLPADYYVVGSSGVVTTKDKDKDKDKDKSYVLPNGNTDAPTLEQPDSVPEDGKGNGKLPRSIGVRELVADGVDRKHAEDWLKVRSAKRAPLTQTAWDDVKAEAAKAGIMPGDAVRVSATNSWQGFKAAWYAKLKKEWTRVQAAGSGAHDGYEKRDYGKGGAL